MRGMKKEKRVFHWNRYLENHNSRLFISNSKRVTTQQEETRRHIVQQLNQSFCFSSLPSASTYFRLCKVILLQSSSVLLAHTNYIALKIQILCSCFANFSCFLGFSISYSILVSSHCSSSPPFWSHSFRVVNNKNSSPCSYRKNILL